MTDLPNPTDITYLHPHPAQQKLPDSATLGAVHLDVTGAEQARTFWTTYVGLTDLGDRDGLIRLGVDDKEMVVLHPGAHGPVAARHTGLYHLAIHVPTRKDLARLAARLYGLRWEHGPTDHAETMATYFNDPDGNGIEITFETPERGSLATGNNQYFAVLADGTTQSGTEPLDVDDLLSELTDDDNLLDPLPSGSRLGHVHLHVNDLAAARTFYIDTIGLGDMRHFEKFKMADFSLATSYVPHALAVNMWNGTDAQPKPEGTAGLREWHLHVTNEKELRIIASRLEEAGIEAEIDAEAIHVQDPAGNPLVISIDRAQT